MSDPRPKKQTKPQAQRIDGPPKPPTKVTVDLDELGGPRPEDHPVVEMANALTNAKLTWFELMKLNGGGRRLKRESFELSLDRNIILLSRVFSKLERKHQKMVADTLVNIRDYRLRHPRTDPSNSEQAEQAQTILDEIPEV
jgi:hypothetical protein